jgi:hypothetical protein
VHSRLATAAPPRPRGSYAAVPDTNDLPQADPTCRPLEAAQLEALRGQGTQWIVYVGKLRVNLASHGIHRPPQTQAAPQHQGLVEVSAAELAVLRVHYGDDVVVCPSTLVPR